MVQGTWTPTKRRGPIAAEFQTPGPGSCNLPSLIGRESPKFTITGRHEFKERSQGPAPSEYNTRQLTNKGKDVSPEISMAGRVKDHKPFVTPAPGSYQVKEGPLVESAPRYSFGLRTDVQHPNGVPAPNSYTIPGLVGDRSSPKFTIVGKGRDVPDERRKYPSPAQYDAGSHLDSVRTRQPAFSLSQRTQLPTDSTQKPGPAAYTIQQSVLKRDPQYSFGLKHSPYIGSLQPDEEDNTVVQQSPAVRRTTDNCQHQIPAVRRTTDNGQQQVAIVRRTTDNGQQQVATVRRTSDNGQQQVATVRRTSDNGQQQVATVRRTSDNGQQQVATVRRTSDNGQQQVAIVRRTNTVQQGSAVRRTEKTLRSNKEVVRVSAEGVTCRWVDRGVKYDR